MVMERSAREDVREVLRRFGIGSARRASTTDATEEVILLAPADAEVIDADELTLALMNVLPHKKVWVTADGPRWTSEEL